MEPPGSLLISSFCFPFLGLPQKPASGNQTDVLWEVDGTPHAQTYRNYLVEYITKVSEFFNSALNVNSQ
jgi:hypothetical protein